MSLGVELGLSPGDIVLDGDPAPPPPKNGPCLLWPKSWMDEADTWHVLPFWPVSYTHLTLPTILRV